MKYSAFALLFWLGCLTNATAQTTQEQTIITALPFLRIAPDARSSAMGDAGIATTADANSLYFNASNLAFAEQDLGLSLTYTSWLRAMGISDVFLGYLSGYKKIKNNQAIGLGLRYFSVGQLQYSDDQGNPLQTVNPYELAIDFAYARKLGKTFSIGLTLHYFLSNLGSGNTSYGMTMQPAHAFGADLSITYLKELKLGKKKAILTAGIALSNFGTKVSYTDNGEQDYMPANLGFGSAFEFYADSKNSITLTMDINKLLVPTPIAPYIEDGNGNMVANPAYDADNNNIPDYKQQSVPAALFTSMGDAPGGAAEEFNELMFSWGLEYWYNKQFALRWGYYYEHQNKGNRQFFSIGIGVKYKVFNFNFSYLIPAASAQSNPLDNTLRFSLLFNFGTPKMEKKK